MKNKFSYESDFHSLSEELGYQKPALPNSIKRGVGGFWQIGDKDSTELSADFIEQIKNDSTKYGYFFISNVFKESKKGEKISHSKGVS